MSQKDKSLLFSIIVPVYNRPDEIKDLLDSLRNQSDKGFEIILVEDGSTIPCLPVEYKDNDLSLKYYAKSNEGRSIARNYGLRMAEGDYFIFVDSDCILPGDYIEKLRGCLRETPLDCFGGPDAAHDSFSDMQKAINYSMTTFLTTGGIRGGKVSMEKFTPRTFNMGFSRAVFEKVGGFREMFSEDIDMSTRIRMAGFRIGLFPDIYVYHKRRIDLKKFWKQVYVFGMSRITLELLYPGSMKLVHWLPAVFTLGCIGLVVGSIFYHWLILFLICYVLAFWIGALVSTRRIGIANKAVLAAFVQLWGYGSGFINAYFNKIILKRGRNIENEVEIRKGSNEGL